MNRKEYFTCLYRLAKTLRFKLEPVETTLQRILDGGILEQDRHRAESYVLVKKIIDDYHKNFIERVLACLKLKLENEGQNDSLSEYSMYYGMKNRNEQETNAFKTIQNNLRNQIAESFSKDDAFKNIGKKELIRCDLISFVETLSDDAYSGASPFSIPAV